MGSGIEPKIVGLVGLEFVVREEGGVLLEAHGRQRQVTILVVEMRELAPRRGLRTDF